MKPFPQILRTHQRAEHLNPANPVYARTILNHLLEPLLADLSGGGDITTSGVLPMRENIRAVLVAKQTGVLAGMQEIVFFLDKRWAKGKLRRLFGNIQLVHSLKDGAALKKGTVITELRGNVQDILKLERTLLNFLQHMSGVATVARRYVHECRDFRVMVCPTRKTPWGLLDKRACVVGGAGTHRLNLADAVLVKDTHLDLLGHDFKLLEKRLKEIPNPGRFLEIEVETLADARKAVGIFAELQKREMLPCFLMLDNFGPKRIGTFMREFRSARASRRIFVEASGGIHLKNICRYAATGVDVLSVGALTHSAPALDISLKVKP